MDFIEGIEQFSERPLILADDGSIHHYRDVLDLSGVFYRHAAARRLVFCICSNTPAALLGYLALLRVGAVPAMLGAGVSPAQLQGLQDAYRPALIWTPAERLDDFPGAARLFDRDGYSLLAIRNAPDIPIHEDLALLLTTSGSTGSPLFVRQSRQNIASNAAAIADYLGIAGDDMPITTLPLHYTYGLSIIHSHLQQGCAIALTARNFFDRGFWDFLRASAPTSFGGVPYHYEILRKLRFWRMALPSLRTLTQAGGRMEPALSREFAEQCAERAIRYYTMYGQAEATARMSYLAPEFALEKFGSIGKPIPGGEFWLEGERGERIESSGSSGQLVYRGANVTMGYAQGHADLARPDESGGVLRTGDLAQRDADGFYYITGRLKRFLKLFGHRVNLQEVEQLLLAQGHVAVCAGEDDRLAVYLCGGDGPAALAAKQMLVDILKTPASAIAIYAIDSVPRNEAGKILYGELAHCAGRELA